MKKFRVFIVIFSVLSFMNLLASTTLATEGEEEKIIYLTFDDGPGGKVTTHILDTLKSEGVNATFFLIGNQVKGQEALVKRIHSEGHSIGLHSMSHERSRLYSSNDNFLKEMIESQVIIKEVVGISPTILRFPFGCNNSCYKLKKSLVDLLHENNFRIYDWNVDTTDGANSNASKCTLINKAKSNKNTIILLMHCGYINENSSKALPQIIQYYKNQGYTFKAINDETPEVFHYIHK